MKKNTLKTLGIMVLSAALLAGAVTGCGSKETADVVGTETVAVTETEEATEMVEVAEETALPEETEVIEETETEEAPAFTVTELSAVKYAKQSVNVRKGPSSDYEKLGGLSMNQKVTVTGQADTGWFRIDYNGKEGYVSDKYLSDQKVSAPAKSTGGSAASGNNGGNAGNTGAAGNTGNAENVNNAGNTNNAGNGGNTGSTGNANTGNTNSTPAPDNGGSTPAPDNSGNAGGTDQGGATVPDNSGSADAENNGGTATPPEGSVIDPNTGMSVPEDFEDDFAGMDVGGADDGTGLGGEWEWN